MSAQIGRKQCSNLNSPAADRNSDFCLYVLFLSFSHQKQGVLRESIVLPVSIRVSVIITDFCLRVYTIRQNNPRTKVRTLANVKMPLKAHGNNVTLESM